MAKSKSGKGGRCLRDVRKEERLGYDLKKNWPCM